jgi:hypothetical protein
VKIDGSHEAPELVDRFWLVALPLEWTQDAWGAYPPFQPRTHLENGLRFGLASQENHGHPHMSDEVLEKFNTGIPNVLPFPVNEVPEFIDKEHADF